MRREARDWAGLQAASHPMHQQGGQEQRRFQDALHQGVATDLSALRRCTQRPGHPAPCPSPSWAREGGPIPRPHCPDCRRGRGALLPGRFPDLLICVPLPGLLLDLRPCFSKGSAASPSPGPQGVASASITKLCDKKCGPLIKIM